MIYAPSQTANINGFYRYAIISVNTTPSILLSRRLLRKLLLLFYNGYITIVFTLVFGRVITVQNSKAPFLFYFVVMESKLLIAVPITCNRKAL